MAFLTLQQKKKAVKKIDLFIHAWVLKLGKAQRHVDTGVACFETLRAAMTIKMLMAQRHLVISTPIKR